MEDDPDHDTFKIEKEIIIVILVSNCRKNSDTWR